MTLSLNRGKIGLRKWIALAVIAVLVNTTSVFAQDDQDQDPALIDNPVSVPGTQSSPSVGSGPWGNSSSSSARPSTRENNSIAPSARPISGETTLGTDPGGNPDVPFDTNMNIAFLVVGLVFAFVVYKKRFALKSEPLNK